MQKTLSRREALAGTGALAGGLALAGPAMANHMPACDSTEAARDLWQRYVDKRLAYLDAADESDEIRCAARRKHMPYDDSVAFVRREGKSGVYLYRRKEHGHDPSIQHLEQTEIFHPATIDASKPCDGIRRAIMERENKKVETQYRAECRRLGIKAAERREKKLEAEQDALQEAILTSTDASPAMLLLRLALWRERTIGFEGEEVSYTTHRAVISAYDLLAQQTGFDPVSDMRPWLEGAA